MKLGAFSVSLAVKDLAVSQAFYEKLGFTVAGGDGVGYQIMANGSTIVGLFQGMFEENILTFNPGLEQDTSRSESFTDVREIERMLAERGIKTKGSNTAVSAEGAAHIEIVDPDGNSILIDQFF
jgi:lactoylglutathione lyase